MPIHANKFIESLVNLSRKPIFRDMENPLKAMREWTPKAYENVQRNAENAFKFIKDPQEFVKTNYNETQSFNVVPPLGQEWLTKAFTWVYPNMRIDTDDFFPSLKKNTNILFERSYYRVLEFFGDAAPITIEASKNRRIRGEYYNLTKYTLSEFDKLKRRIGKINSATPDSDVRLQFSNMASRAKDKFSELQPGDYTWKGFLEEWESHMFKGTSLNEIQTPEIKNLVDRTRKQLKKIREEAEELGIFPDYKKFSDDEVLTAISRDRAIRNIPADEESRIILIDKWRKNQAEKLDKYWTVVYDPVLIQDNRYTIYKILHDGYMNRENISFQNTDTMALKRIYSGTEKSAGINELKLRIEYNAKEMASNSDPKKVKSLKMQNAKYEKKIKALENKYKRLEKKIKNETEEQYAKRKEFWESNYRKNVNKTIDKIIHSPTAYLDRMPQQVKKSDIRYFRHKVLDDFREQLHPYMERDPLRVSHIYNRYIIPRIEEKKSGFDLDMVIKDLQADADEALKKNPEKQTEISRRFEQRKKDLIVMHERVMNQDIPNQDPRTWGAHVTNDILKINNMLKLNNVTLSSTPDIGNIIMRYGFKRFGKMLNAIGKDPELRKELSQFPSIGVGGDMLTMLETNLLSDVYYGAHGTMLDRSIDWMSKQSGMLTLLNQWTDGMKRFTGLLAQDDILKNAVKFIEEGKIDSDTALFLRHNGIGDEELSLIGNEWLKGGKHSHDGVYLANSEQWDTTIRDLFDSSLVRLVDNIIVTPNAGSKPLMASTNIGRLAFQYRSFSLQATQTILLAGLQVPDAKRLNGILMTMFFGWVAYSSKTISKGKELSDNPMHHLTEAIDRSGLLGLLSDANMLAERMSGGRVGINPMLGGSGLTRTSHIGASGMLSPTIGTIDDAFKATSGLFDELPGGQVTAGQVNAQFRMIPYSNLFYINWLTNKARSGVKEYYGVDDE